VARIGLLAVALSACSFTPGMLASSDGAIDTTVTGDADITTGWSMPKKIDEIATPMGNDDPSLTDDLLELYFGSPRPGGMGMEDIWVAKRNAITEPFGTPQPVTDLNSSMSETTMKITGNGKAIYFASNRGGTGHDIYFSTRTERDQPWTNPMRVDALSTSNGDWGPAAQTDQLRLVLCSGASPMDEALFVSTRANTAVDWSSPDRIDELDVPNISECDPWEPRSGVLYYGSDFLNTADGTFDIYRASRNASGDPYGNRTSHSINMPGINDRDPWVSADERTMVFTSDRDLVNFQIYITTRQ
jgi:Tol biopolymer transport system component